MSDDEGGKKSGYRLEYSASGRGKCNGPKPCKGTKIEKGELRFGSLVDFKGNTSFSWRHWGCVTSQIIANVKKTFEEADDLDGFEDLEEEDQEKVRKAWEEGRVADEDIPDSARKPEGEDAEDDDDDEGKPKKKKASAKAKKDAEDDSPKKGVFKLEYASSGRAKCKTCGASVGKDFFRLGHEVDFRGNKSLAWRHWGCADPNLIGSMKLSYSEPSEIDGFNVLKSAEQEKVQRAWEDGAIPAEDCGPGEAVDTGKKAPVKRKKKNEDGHADEKPKKTRGRKAKPKDEDDEDEDESEEKPKRKRAPAAKKDVTEKKAKGPSKKRAPKKNEDEESGEDFGEDIAALSGGEDEEEEMQEEPATKKRKRAPISKASSKPVSKRAKPASSRGKKREEIAEESELEEDD